MGLSTHADDHCFTGTVVFAGNMTLPVNAVTDVTVIAAANVAASKLEHQYEPCYSQEPATTGAVDAKVIHIVKGATGTLIDFRVGAYVAAIGAATTTWDLKKNGTTILTGTISLTSATAAFAKLQPGGYTSTSLVTGDVLTVHITAATAGGGTIAKGLFAQLVVREAAQ